VGKEGGGSRPAKGAKLGGNPEGPLDLGSFSKEEVGFWTRVKEITSGTAVGVLRTLYIVRNPVGLGGLEMV